MKYLSHPLVVPETLEERRYQIALALRALDGNTLLVLPTGLGKTAVALIVAASRLYTEKGKVLFLAPTKPLVEQHLQFFRKFLNLPKGEGPCDERFAMFTGETPWEERKNGWEKATVCFATPQVVKNDVVAGRYSLHVVTLLIVDECHRAVGNYAYVYLAQRYMATAENPLILGITASPGGDRERVQEICKSLHIAIVESRVETDEDVAPYVHDREIQVIPVDLPRPLADALKDLHALLGTRLAQLERMHYPVPKAERLSMKALNALNLQIQRRIQERDRSAYLAASIYAECMKIRHAISLAESQGSEALKHYLEKLANEGTAGGGTKASQRLAKDPAFADLLSRVLAWKEELHAKGPIVAELIRQQFADNPASRIIVFATYRDMVQLLVDRLNAEGIACERFVGQATKDTEKGLSQKQQIEALQRFRAGEFRVLVATSVGEEGLDIPSTDMVIFYEAVPSEIRSIQRKGRTGRHSTGRIAVLVTKGTSDEVFRHVSQARERQMVRGMKTIASVPAQVPRPVPKQASIDAFDTNRPVVVVDDRESSSRVVEHLAELGTRVDLRRLDAGDYAIGDRILVERKTARDFVTTLVDRDLFGQLRALADASLRPVLIIEGGNIYTERNIHPNAIRGTLAAIVVDLGIGVFFTENEAETAEMLHTLAKREEAPAGERTAQPHKGYRSMRQVQESVIAAFPSVGLKTARLLLEAFGSVEGVITAETEALEQVKGIGERTAGQISEIAKKPYP
jgi:Fanconi anemia group M protein